MDSSEKKIVTVGDEGAMLEVTHSLRKSAIYIELLQSNSSRDQDEVFETLGIDTLSRKELVSRHQFETPLYERRTLRTINKGLSLELLTGMFLSHIDGPTNVHAHCSIASEAKNDEVKKLNNGHATAYHATAGKPDLEVSYTTFKLLIEVSVCKNTDISHYHQQLNSAARHAEAARESGYDKPIFVLLVNNHSLTDSKVKNALINKAENLTNQNIHFVSLSLDEFTVMGETIGRFHKNDSNNLSTEEFEYLLMEAAKGVFQKKPVMLDELMLQHFSFGG